MSHFSTEPEFRPRPGDFAAAAARADRRRVRRRLAVTACSTPVAALVALALTASGSPGGGDARLATQGGGDASAAGVPYDPTSTEAASLAPSVGPPAEPSRGPLDLPSGVLPTLSPSPSPSPAPSSGPSRPASPGRPRPDSSRKNHPAGFERRPGTAPDECLTQPLETSEILDPEVHDRNWCSRYAGPSTVRSGDTVELPFEICRAANAGASTLHSGAGGPGRWLHLAIVGSDHPIWGWGEPSEPMAPTVDVAAGECVRWTVTWDTRDKYCDRMPPGEKSIDTTYTVDEKVQNGGHSLYSITVTE